MATITQSDVMSPTVDPQWIPSPLYRMSLEQYEAMVASGVFTKRDRFHLINGYLVAKMTQNPPHSVADELCGQALDRTIPDGWHVRPAKPVRLPSQISEPEPDRCVVRRGIRDYLRRHPEPAEVALIVEVSDTSLSEDRKMSQIYAAAGIPVYWIVNLVHGQVEVYTDPGPGGYGSRRIFKPGRRVPVVIAGVEVGRIRVADILP
jgi:Uma2 family endonuclease